MTNEGLVTQYARKHFPQYFVRPDPEQELCEALVRMGADPTKVDSSVTEYGQYWKRWGYPEDWKELARKLANQDPPRSLEFIHSHIVGVYSPRSPSLSEVQRAVDPAGAEKHARHQRDYVKRHPERRAKSQAEYYARNRETILAKRRAKRAQQDIPTGK